MKNYLNIKTLCNVSILIAMEVVLNRFLSLNAFNLKIGFGFVPIVLCAIMYGPVIAGVTNAVADVIGATLFPIGPYFPGFTLTALLVGFVFGLFLHRQEVKFFPNIISASVINCIVFSLGLNTMWISILYGAPVAGLIPTRLLQCSILIPVQLVMIPLLLKINARLIKAKALG